MQDIETLKSNFHARGLQFLNGPGGLVQAVIRTPTCSGSLFLHGAHVSEWTPAGHQPVLWMSKESYFTSGKPIRGGIPICFPWFGSHRDDSSKPAHGTARITEWTLTQVEQLPDDAVALELQNTIDGFQLRFRVEFGCQLGLQMTVENSRSANSVSAYELALHTYFSVGDIHRAGISGLEKSQWIDKVDGGTTKPASGESIVFKGETDRVYFDTQNQCELSDPTVPRKVVVKKTGSNSTIIWNPWIAKSQRMPDFGDHEWSNMVCIETANVGPNRVQLSGGQKSELTVLVSVE